MNWQSTATKEERQERGVWENAEYTLKQLNQVWHRNECDERLDDDGCE